MASEAVKSLTPLYRTVAIMKPGLMTEMLSPARSIGHDPDANICSMPSSSFGRVTVQLIKQVFSDAGDDDGSVFESHRVSP
jgi:hypothetical protein